MTSSQTADWATYLRLMEDALRLELDETRRAALLEQFTRIAAMAEPLMDFPLDPRLEVAGVFKA